MKAEWKNAHAFAEVAETLGVPTDAIMAYLPDQVVLWTPRPDDPDPVIHSAKLGRDADGILRASPPATLGTLSDWDTELRSIVDAMDEDEDQS